MAGRAVEACADTDSLFVQTNMADNTTSSFRSTDEEGVSSEPQTVALFDLDMDGGLDAVVLSHYGVGLVKNNAPSFLAADPDWTFDESSEEERHAVFSVESHVLPNVRTTAGLSWVPEAGEASTFADVTGDGYTDIFRQDRAAVLAGDTSTVLLENQGNGSYVAQLPEEFASRNLPLQLGSSYESHLIMFDCNNDGLLDMFVTEQAMLEDGLRVALSPGIYSNRTRYVVTDPSWRIVDYVVPADMNADGNIDLVASFGVANWEPMIMLNSGNCTFNEDDWIIGALGGQTCHRAIVLDVQNDGALDVVCGNEVFLGDADSLDGKVMKVLPVGQGLRRDGLDVRVELSDAATGSLVGVRVSSPAQGGQQHSAHLHFGVPLTVDRLNVVAFFQPVGGGPLVRREVVQCLSGQLNVAVHEDALETVFCHDPPTLEVVRARTGTAVRLTFTIGWADHVDGELLELAVSAPAAVHPVGNSSGLRWVGTANDLNEVGVNLTADAPGTYVTVVSLSAFVGQADDGATGAVQRVEANVPLEFPSEQGTGQSTSAMPEGGLGGSVGPAVEAPGPSSTRSAQGMDVGLIIAIVVGVLLCLVLLCLVFIVRVRRRNSSPKKPSLSVGPMPSSGSRSRRRSINNGQHGLTATPAPVGGEYGALPPVARKSGGVTYERLAPNATYGTVAAAPSTGNVYEAADTALHSRVSGSANRFTLTTLGSSTHPSRTSEYDSVSNGATPQLYDTVDAARTPSRGSTYDTTSSILQR